jgi:hypothetical protein
VYDVDPLDDAVGVVPGDLVAEYAEVRAPLEVSPRSVGRPWVATDPTGIRVVTFGAGRAAFAFGVIEDERRVFLVSLVVA